LIAKPSAARATMAILPVCELSSAFAGFGSDRFAIAREATTGARGDDVRKGW
jgi:hypothetical protein